LKIGKNVESSKRESKSYKRKILSYTNRKIVMIKDDRTEEAYRIIESKVNEMLTDKAGYDPLEIAGVMCAQAIRIYKSCLTPQDYDDIMEAIFVSRLNIEQMKGPTKH